MIIYKITNTVNGKSYIGQTTNPDPYQRVRAHFKKTRTKDLVWEAKQKYGRDSFKWEILYHAFDLEELNRVERMLISTHNTLVPNGYNIQIGGDGTGKLTEDTKLLIGRNVKNWYINNSHPLKGKQFTSEHIQNLSKVRKGFDSEARQIARAKNYETMRIDIIATNIATNQSFEFNSIEECAKCLNLGPSNISRVLAGKQNRKQHKGYTFKKLDKQAKEE